MAAFVSGLYSSSLSLFVLCCLQAPQQRGPPLPPAPVPVAAVSPTSILLDEANRMDSASREQHLGTTLASPLGSEGEYSQKSSVTYCRLLLFIRRCCLCALAGELLYPLVSQLNSDLAPKLTGMLLQLPVEEVVSLIGDQAKLAAKVKEGMALLQNITDKAV